MSRSVKKGPFVQEKLLKRIQEMNEKNEKKGFKDLVQSIDNLSGDGRAYDCSTRRT